MNHLLDYLTAHPMATLTLGQCEYEGAPAWACMIRECAKPAGDDVAGDNDVIEYAPTLDAAIGRAVRRLGR